MSSHDREDPHVAVYEANFVHFKAPVSDDKVAEHEYPALREIPCLKTSFARILVAVKLPVSLAHMTEIVTLTKYGPHQENQKVRSVWATLPVSPHLLVPKHGCGYRLWLSATTKANPPIQ